MSRHAAVVVGFNVAETLPAVLKKLPSSLLVVVVDDGSTDGGLRDVPEGVVVLRHAKNRGYGAAQKTGYAEALSRGAERVAHRALVRRSGVPQGNATR